MDAQVITGVAASTPYVNSGTPNNAGNGGVADSGSSSSILTASIQGQTDVVDINQTAGSGQEYQKSVDLNSKLVSEQRVSVNGKSSTRENVKSVDITYNQLARESVIKFLDEEGNIVSQTPPRMYLKTMEARSSKLDAHLGKLLNEVA
jgi:E3 ubiquitin-protein ligase DOA10